MLAPNTFIADNTHSTKLGDYETAIQSSPQREKHSFASVFVQLVGGFIYGDDMKKCRKCETDKPTEQFSKNSGAPDGLYHWCKPCVSAHDKKRRKSLPPEYSVWQKMRERCNNPNNKAYNYYGGRGIKVCERWDSFDSFFADMGQRPAKGYEIDRIDNDGGYTPDNCQWITHKENSRKRSNGTLSLQKARDIRVLHLFGISPMHLADQFGVSVSSVYHVIRNRTWVDIV